MSSIPPSMHIASSVSQAAHRQSEVAKGPDRARAESRMRAGRPGGAASGERFAQKMRKELRKHLETVEDSYEPTDELIRIEADGRNDRNGSAGNREQEADSTEKDPESGPNPGQDQEQPPSQGLDLEA